MQQPRKILWRTRSALVIGAALAAAAATGFAAPLTVAPNGEAMRSCGPTDGPSIQMRFPASERRQLVLNLYVPMETSVGTWPVGSGDQRGGLWAGICPASSYPCEEIASGELAITRYADGLIEGNWRLKLSSGAKIESAFKATWSPQRPRPRCG